MLYSIRCRVSDGRCAAISCWLRNSLLAFGAGALASLAASLPALGASLWSNTAVPALQNVTGSPYELGVKFQSDVNGYITGFRFYKSSKDTGTHAGHLWSSGGSLLASATFKNETASGWQQVTLSTPVAIQAHTTYIASYWDPTGYHSANRNYFTATYNNVPLHALANGASGPNGVYRMGSSGFPTSTTNQSSNYWVDVVFTPASSDASLWSNTTVPALQNVTGSPYELGVKFQSDVNGYIMGFRFFKSSKDTGTHVGHLWSSGGSLLASATFKNETASGWQQVTLSTPVAIQAHTTYVASYWDPTGYHSANRYYFTTTYNNVPLHALANGTSGPNGVYRMGSSGFPTSTTYQSSNYWVDVVFLAGTNAPAGSSATTLQLTAKPSSLSFGNVTTGSTSTLPVVLSNTGSSSVSVSLATVSGTGFRLSGSFAPITLAAGQNTSFSVVFAPTAVGSVTGSVSVVSTASNSPAVVALSGAGVGTHSVTLSWQPSASSGIAGYNVYRGAASGGPYTKCNSSLIAGTTYKDSTVQAGQTYYYVSTAVTSGNVESSYSNQVKANIP